MKLFSRLAKPRVLERLAMLNQGTLILNDRGMSHSFGDGTSPKVTVQLHSDSFYSAVALGGHIGAAESYMDGDWDTDDLTGLVRLFVRNRKALDGLETGTARFMQPVRDLFHLFRRNTRSGSRKNIHAHYDLGNDLFERFLDETMTYSSGIFTHTDATMQEASIEKYDRICRTLSIKPGDRVVEIGSGWGGFAIHAASKYGARVTTTTISERQFSLASERIREAGVEDRVTLLLSDYRDLRGEYDKLVSIEMIEAVGHDYYGDYFESCSALLKPGGAAVIQAITVPDHHYEAARREVDFIKRYIFPGSNIPSVDVLAKAASSSSLRLAESMDFAPHYGETLRRWRARFEENWPEIRQLGYDEPFRRLWNFYLSYCEGGFDEGALGLVHLHFADARDDISEYSARQLAKARSHSRIAAAL